MISSRIKLMNKQNIANGKNYVLLLIRCIRSRMSPSFSYASRRANELSVPLLITFIYQPNRHNLAQRKFLLDGLKCLENAFQDLGAAFVAVKIDSDREAIETIMRLSDNACEVITDAAYLRDDRRFEEILNDKLVMKCRRLTRIEGNVVVPITVLSNEPAFNANTIRKMIWHFVDDMLHEKWDETPKIRCKTWKSIVTCDLESMNISREIVKAANDCKTDSGLIGGEIAAQRILDAFIANKLSTYDRDKNISNGGSQSFLSAYIHFGMLSPMEIIARVQQAEVPKSAKDAFLEQLVVRRELAHNFVYYYRDTYDTLNCLPSWAKKTLDEHRSDKREHVYSYMELEKGRTHDPYWNAAQFEMVYTHKMVGYLRMYWAKKVIEWTANYEAALAFLIEQNDKYQLDGRDPNGYSGILWNFGMHDRAHAKRPVFGTIRYMCADGIRRKFRKYIDEYVKINYERAGGRTTKRSDVQEMKKTSGGLEPEVKRTRKTTENSLKKI